MLPGCEDQALNRGWSGPGRQGPREPLGSKMESGADALCTQRAPRFKKQTNHLYNCLAVRRAPAVTGSFFTPVLPPSLPTRPVPSLLPPPPNLLRALSAQSAVNGTKLAPFRHVNTYPVPGTLHPVYEAGFGSSFLRGSLTAAHASGPHTVHMLSLSSPSSSPTFPPSSPPSLLPFLPPPPPLDRAHPQRVATPPCSRA
jgi:hypothetical protein